MSIENALVESAHSFAQDMLGKTARVIKGGDERTNAVQKNSCAASMWVSGGENWHIRVHFTKPCLKKIAAVLLEDKTASDATLSDLVCEISNVIVGHAKMIAAQKGTHFDVSTPHFDAKFASISKLATARCYFELEGDIFALTARKVR